MGVTSALSKAMKAIVKGDARAFADHPRIAIPEPYEHVGWHMTRGDWVTRNPVLDLRQGEGFGLHVGTRKAAEDRAVMKSGPQTYIDIAALPARRTIHSPADLGSWRQAENWIPLLQRRVFEGLTPEESDLIAEAVRRHVDETNWTQQDVGGLVRKMLQEMGVDRVTYRNIVEDKGSLSTVLLNPAQVRWASKAGFHPEKRDVNHLLASGVVAVPSGALSGGAFGALRERKERRA